ncbi:MAG: [protein-PII] uridylyltransferase [Pseudomonadota bacterium]
MAEPESAELIQRREQLIQKFLKKRNPDFIEEFSGCLDDYFHSVFEKSTTAHRLMTSGNPVALVALGGYGRQEQCIHSDVDLLILFEKKIPDTAAELVKELLYPLWDVRLETGYAVRTINDCLCMAWKQFDILTTLLDARFICGSSPIYSQLMEKFRKALSRKYMQKSLSSLVEHGEKLHTAFGDSTYLLEPNLKSGHGGLRDYHTLLWYGRIISDIKQRRELEQYGFVSHDEYQAMKKSLEFIWTIRNMLHYVTGRKCDQLHFEHQIEMAKLMGFREENGHQAVESFMGELHSSMEFIKQINLVVTENVLINKKIIKSLRISRPTNFQGIEIIDRRLNFTSMEMVPRNPELLMRVFVESGRLKIPLSIESRRIVGEFKHLVNARFRKDPANVEDFEKILAYSLWEFNVLNVMHSTGLLEKFIPEFSLIANKIQYNQYHLFPVDKHSIRCVQIVNDLKNKPFYAEVYQEIRNRRILLMAALFHDIGKGDPASEHSEKGAQITRTILTRIGYKPGEIEDTEFLVRHHLFLVKTATRRDISDEETAVFCANRIQKVGTLRMLYLLSVADSMATGPKAWNEWTESLLRDLYIKTLSILKTGELSTSKALKTVQQKKDEVLALAIPGWDPTQIQKDLDTMSQRYLLYVPPKEIVEHISLYRKMGDRNYLWKIHQEPNSDIRTVTICGRDKPGFYSKLAGVFFMNNLNIIGSQAYSWGDNIALDIFKVMPPRDRIFESDKWEKAGAELDRALTDDTFLDRLQEKLPRRLTPESGQIPRPNQVRIDNDTSRFFTIIEVFTHDFPGLLFAVTNTLYRQGLDVRMAMVATKVDQVVDVFYVRSVNDEKILQPDRVEAIKRAILQNLPEIELKTGIITEEYL